MKNSPVTRFIWIRHAPVEKETGYVPDHDPNARYDAGAAERLGRAMPENARWIMSPLKRTRQTAEQVRQHLNHQAQHPEDEHIEPDIIEQDLGRWAGSQLTDVWQELAPLPKHNFSFLTIWVEVSPFLSRIRLTIVFIKVTFWTDEDFPICLRCHPLAIIATILPVGFVFFNHAIAFPSIVNFSQMRV